MPSVYLARVNNGDPLPSFVHKEIGNRMPGVVSDITVVVTDTTPILYPAYLFRAFIQSIMTHSIVQVSGLSFISAFAPIRNLSRLFETPIFSFRFKNLSPGQHSQLKGYGLQQELSNPNVFVGAPESHLLREISRLEPIPDRLRPGHVTYEGFLAWVYLMKGLMIFGTTKNNTTSAGFNVMTNESEAVKSGTSGNIVNMMGEASLYQNQTSCTISRVTGRLMVAPPAVKQEMIGSFLDVNNLPALSMGIFFPYFNGMNTMDKTTSYEVFSQLFSGCLADKSTVDVAIMAKIRVGTRQLAFHRTGIILSHIYKCMQISMDIGDAKFHVITKGSVYCGCVIEGSFSVIVHGVKYNSGDVMGELAKINLLESQALELSVLINAAEGDAGAPYHYTKEDFYTSRSCVQIYNSLNPTLFHSTDTMTKIKSIMKKMEFNDVFPQPNTENIRKCISSMLTGDKAVLQEFPAFLGGEILEKPGRVTESLSMFGPRVPSCNYGKDGGLVFALPAPGKEDTHITKVEGVRPLQYLPFQVVPLQVGITQWESLISTGVLRLPKGRKGRKEFTDLHGVQTSITADPVFSDVYNMIKTMVNEARESGKATGKRKRGGGEDHAESKGKKAKISEEDAYF